MPTTITSYNTFAPLTSIESAKVNANFSNHRGDLIPIHESTATAGTTGTYSLGTDEYTWLHGKVNNLTLKEYDTTTSAPTPGNGFRSLISTTNDQIYSIDDSGTATRIPFASEVMPAGAIIAYGANSAPSGYLICDGSSVSRTTYATLFAVIGTAFGTNTTTSFNVPDLRGMFLRGTDNGAGTDDDAATRTALATGGNTGDTVGSYQDDAFENHDHDWAGAFDAGPLSGATAGSTYQAPWNQSNLTLDGPQPSGNIASETRPKNVGVYYIIKT